MAELLHLVAENGLTSRAGKKLKATWIIGKHAGRTPASTAHQAPGRGHVRRGEACPAATACRALPLLPWRKYRRNNWPVSGFISRTCRTSGPQRPCDEHPIANGRRFFAWPVHST